MKLDLHIQISTLVSCDYYYYGYNVHTYVGEQCIWERLFENTFINAYIKVHGVSGHRVAHQWFMVPAGEVK